MNEVHLRQRSREKDQENEVNKGISSQHHSPLNYFKKYPNKQFNYNKGAKIIINQLPINITEETLLEECKKFGFVKRCNVIKGKNDSFNTGIVLMPKVEHAQKAISFINLNYKWNALILNNQKNNYKESFSPHIGNEKKKNLIDQSKLREICIVNIPHSISQELIYSYFFIYGEIEDIEMHEKDGFAFIRYFTTASAKLAYDQGNNSNVENRKIKIKYSDYNKRNDIIGNKLGYNYDNNTCKTLVVCYSKNLNLPTQDIISRIFSNYGQVKALYLKHCLPNTEQKPKIYIDYDKYGDASKMLEFFNNPEIHKTICDFLLDFNILIIPLVNLFPQLRINQDLSSVLQNFRMQNATSNYFQNTNNFEIQSPGFLQKAKSEEKFLIPQSSLSTNLNNQTSLLNSYAFFPANGLKQQTLEKSSSSNSILNQSHSISFQRSNSLQDYYIESQGKQKEKAKQFLNIEETFQFKPKTSFENLNHIWSGFITKRKKSRVGVDAYLIKGNIADSLIDYNLNISHKIDLTFFNNNYDAPGILIFAPSNETQIDIFNIYLSKLQKKQKAGVISLHNNKVIYLIPPCNISKQFFYSSEIHLLGLFFSSNNAPF